MKLIVLGLLFAAVSCFAVPEIKLNGSVTQTGVKQDGKNWIFNLRSGIQFHNGYIDP